MRFYVDPKGVKVHNHNFSKNEVLWFPTCYRRSERGKQYEEVAEYVYGQQNTTVSRGDGLTLQALSSLFLRK